ncbi:MAG: DUF4293 domain-containing protein [Rikenellaceae bacterium]
MIQRKQTLFLLVALILQVIQLFSPLGTIVYNTQMGDNVINETIKLMPFGINSIVLGTISNPISIYYGSILIISAILSLVAIFLFKNRPLQMRITIFSLFATIIVMGLEAYYIYSVVSPLIGNTMGMSTIYSIIMPAPILVVILLFIAHRLILKDEVLIKSNERFR